MMARRNKARLHLLHVIPDVDASVRSYVSTVMGKGSLDHFEKTHEDEARSVITQRLKKFAQDELADHPEDLSYNFV